MNWIPVIVCVPILSGILLAAILRGRHDRRTAKGSETDDGCSDKRRVFGFAHEEISLEQRQRTLKVCPDCGELLVLQADVCKYCGGAVAVEAKRVPDLVLRRAHGVGATGERKSDGQTPKP